MKTLIGAASAALLLWVAPVSAQTATLKLNGPPLAEALGEPVAKTWTVWQDQQKRALAKVPRVTNPVFDPIEPSLIKSIPDNFSREGLLYKGDLPGSAKPDVLGAFRMTCYANNYNYDDSILYQNVVGGSMHGHENFGNSEGNATSTYTTLRTSGDSSCFNKLNRSHYWVPWLERVSDGQIIRSDYLSLYYKRRPKTDPACLNQAKKGCVDLPEGFRAVSGYDPKRFGETQPENDTFHWVCNARGDRPDTVSEWRPTIGAALEDCKVNKYESVQVLVNLGFGDCWNGKLDSPDHRSHIAKGSYGWWGYYKCGDDYPYVIPGLTETIAYTVRKEDGPVRLSSDTMNGKTLPAGTTFHGDYRAAWSPDIFKKFQELCLDGLKNCSYGQLGDGTFLSPLPVPDKHKSRLVTPPVRTTAPVMQHN